jgi:hypothetical protein
MVGARGSEESNAWRQPIDLVPLCEAAFAELPKLLSDGSEGRGNWSGHEALARLLLGDDPAVIVAALKSAIRDGATATALSRAISYAAALRIALFGTSNEHSDWDTALHCFTYCNAVHQLLARITAEMPIELERPELLRCVFHGAMQVYLTRFLNVPPARLPGVGNIASKGLQAIWILTPAFHPLIRTGSLNVRTRPVPGQHQERPQHVFGFPHHPCTFSDASTHHGSGFLSHAAPNEVPWSRTGLEAVVPQHSIRCIVKTTADRHCIFIERTHSSNGGPT